MLFDTHCHLTDPRLSIDAESIVREFHENGICGAVCVGYDAASSEASFSFAAAHDTVFAAVGIHPHDAKSATQADYERFAAMFDYDKTVAIGEIGLDYFYDLSPREVQKRVFLEQLDLAHSLHKPIIVHLRDAYGDMTELLKANTGLLEYGWLLHCYSGSKELAQEYLKLGAYFSFGGAITFKNAVHNVESLLSLPRERVMLETDCPYMTPVPHRGERNEPKYVALVADKVASLWGVDRSQVEDMTTATAKDFFKISL